jgi:DNA-binding GntR family transcriptional regulator
MKSLLRRPTARSGRLSLSEHAYLVIRDRILKGEIPLGGNLSRRKLAAELGMSLLPVAEALQRLENDGLVESRARVGTRVFLPTAADIRERYEIREALESQSARLFAERASVLEKIELEKMADNMDAMFNRCSGEAATDREFLFAVHSYHLQFHSRIAEYTGCRALQATIEKNHVLIFNWLFDVAARRPPLPPRFHRDLIDVINRGDPEQADRAMREHIRHGLCTVVEVLDPRTTATTVQRIK